MTQLNKSQKVIRWASEKKTRSFSKAAKELGYEDYGQLRFLIARLVRHGLVRAEYTGKKVSLRLTQEAYYNRSSLVIAR